MMVLFVCWCSFYRFCLSCFCISLLRCLFALLALWLFCTFFFSSFVPSSSSSSSFSSSSSSSSLLFLPFSFFFLSFVLFVFLSAFFRKECRRVRDQQYNNNIVAICAYVSCLLYFSVLSLSLS